MGLIANVEVGGDVGQHLQYHIAESKYSNYKAVISIILDFAL